LAGGYLIGYFEGTQTYLSGVLGVVDDGVNSLPYLSGAINSLTVEEWYMIIGSVLAVLGLLLVVTGGGGRQKEAKPAKAQAPPVTIRPPGTCKFCGADLKGSKTYCPSCGRSQT
jgi:hypothetical protein